MANPDLFILAQDDAWENRFQVTSLAASAVAAGKRVDLALFFAALAFQLWALWAQRRSLWDNAEMLEELDRKARAGETPAAA